MKKLNPLFVLLLAFAIVGGVLLLSGCGTIGAGGTVKPQIQPLDDPRALKPCPRGDAQPGEDARVVAKRKEGARKCEAARRAALVAYIDDLQKGLAGR